MEDLQPVELTIKKSDPPPKIATGSMWDDVPDPPDIPKEMREETVEAPQQVEKQDDGVELLRRQLAEKQREAEDARRMKTEAERLARQRETEIKTYQVQAEDNKLTAFVNAIASFERDAEMLERDYAEKLAQGDYNSAAKLQRQMAQVESRLHQLAQGREALEEKLKVERQNLEYERQNPRIQQMDNDPIEAAIRNVESPTAQAWLRSHKDVLSDPRKQAKMQAAHWDAVAENIPLDSPDYYAFVEQKIYGAAEQNVNKPSTQRSSRQPMAAAPVSRTPSSQIQRQGGTITGVLSPAERAMARDLGITEEEYLEGKLYEIERGRLNG